MTSFENLTARQIQMVQLIAEGCGNKEIAKQLYVSVDTVKTTLKAAYKHLGVHSRATAVVAAYRAGLIH